MFCAVALSTARRSRGFIDASPPPRRAATVISLMSRVKILPRLASVAAFLCLMFAHLLWPAMTFVNPLFCECGIIRAGKLSNFAVREIAMALRQTRDALSRIFYQRCFYLF